MEDTEIATSIYLSPPLIYGVNEGQLQSLERSGSNYWKEFFYMSLPLGIALFLNGLSLTGDPRSYDFAKSTIKMNIILNYFIGIFFLSVAFLTGITALFTHNEFKRTIQSIRTQQTKYKITNSATSQTITLIPQTPQAPQPPQK